MTVRHARTVAVHVADRSAHHVPVEASATVVVVPADPKAWRPAARRRGHRPGLDPEAVAAVALDGALRLALAARPLEVAVSGPGRRDLLDEVRRRVAVDLEAVGLLVLGLWLGEIADPTGHLEHWSRVRDAIVSAGARVQLAVADRDAVVAEHALAAQAWAAWRMAALAREAGRAEVMSAAVRADHVGALAMAPCALPHTGGEEAPPAQLGIAS